MFGNSFGLMSLSALYLPFFFTISKNALLGVCPGLSPIRPTNIANKALERIPASGIAVVSSMTEIGFSLGLGLSFAAARLVALRERRPFGFAIVLADLGLLS
jgi:hypothetical protein